MYLYITLLLLLTRSMVEAQVDVKEIPHGLIGISHGEANLIGGYWRLYVVIQKPDVPQASIMPIDLMKTQRLLESIVIQDPVMNPRTLERWKLRVLRLRQRLNPIRRKRGLINAGGWLLNKMFGTATEEQIDTVR